MTPYTTLTDDELDRLVAKKLFTVVVGERGETPDCEYVWLSRKKKWGRSLAMLMPAGGVYGKVFSPSRDHNDAMRIAAKFQFGFAIHRAGPTIPWRCIVGTSKAMDVRQEAVVAEHESATRAICITALMAMELSNPQPATGQE